MTPPPFLTRQTTLQAQFPEAAFIIAAHTQITQSADVHFAFRQDSDFFYLTGLNEPDCVLVILPQKRILFAPAITAFKELWEGPFLSQDALKSLSFVDEVVDLHALPERLPLLLKEVRQLYFRLRSSGEATIAIEDQAVSLNTLVIQSMYQQKKLLGRTGSPLLSLHDPSETLGLMRLRKDSSELERLKKACQATAKAHNWVLENASLKHSEKEIQHAIEAKFKEYGCTDLGYGSIVAAGKNATILHYTLNNCALQPTDLLLIDAAGSFDYYTSDVTRTFPIAQDFSGEALAIYECVLAAQQEAIALAKPGTTLPHIHQKATQVLIQGLCDLKILTEKPAQAFESQSYKVFFPHSTSHWLGLDVHDAGAYYSGKNPLPLEPGMVFTVEPGLYFRKVHQGKFPDKFLNIGVRIEDDLLITATGHENLTELAVKTPAQIQEARRRVSS
jgi:Xaa-Pro aminopeptidase